LISRGMDGRLSIAERIALRLHVRICDACTRFTAQLKFLRRALKAYPRSDDPEGR
jgi:Putative zinc-finger